MKKFICSLLVFSSAIALSACGVASPDNAEDNAQSSGQATETSTDAASGASEQEEYTDPSELENKYDVVIVGAGGAGMAAAIQAKEEGANPVILEKLPVAGGNTTKSSGGMNASETKFQEESDIEDSNDTFYDDTLEGGQETNDKKLLRYFVDHSADAIDWLDNMGITLNNISYSGGASVQRIHRPEDGAAVGGYLVDGLLRNVNENEIPIFVNTDVTNINEENGQVDGVEIDMDGDSQTIDAGAVAVTTGGYGANEEMIEENRPDLEGYVSTNSEGSTGDGIKMIEELGGQTVDMDQIQVHPTVIQKDGTLISETVRGEGAILVNQEGERFFNEMETRDKVSEAITDLPEEEAYLIFDDALADRAKQVDFYKEQGVVESGDSIEELAQEINISEDQLKETLDNWNEAVDKEDDQDFERETAMDYDLTDSPFYAIKIAPGIHHTMGGVKINTDTEVLDEDDQAISGLYAAGELTGGLHGNNRIGGNAVADIIIFGRQAGTQATKFAQENN
ncbi:flavocytochrome c [Tetragenococcus halophilus]|uniref:flavocytochrome c n=1 Tax=Tetragenococcus halophilus TaxID=51669 RepID=UPI00209AE0BA|nr:flavocytochrome c [Tetragenococcus halophilus]MCO8291454.1 flavocytochrome c [Tetragenococcus halophilus]